MVNARRRVKAIPPAAARRIAQAYGYDQVIVLGRRLDSSGEQGEHVTAWGPNEAATRDAARLGELARRTILKST
jgi:hypothetical protein